MRSRTCMPIFLMVVCAFLAVTVSPALAVPGTPTVGSINPDLAGVTKIELHAEINPNGEATTYYFEYGPTMSYGTVAPQDGASAGAGVENVEVATTLTGLAPDATYHARLVAVNSHGKVSSEDFTFSTLGLSSYVTTVTNANGSADVQAGSHPYEMKTTLRFTQSKSGELGEPAGSLKDLELALPVGLFGDPQAMPQCPESLLAGTYFGSVGDCPANTQIGIIFANINLGGGIFKLTIPLFNLVPGPGVPAQFGGFPAFFPLVMPVTMRVDHDYAFTVNINDLTQAGDLEYLTIEFWGVPADSGHDDLRVPCVDGALAGAGGEACPLNEPEKAFLTMPTVCGAPLTFTTRIDSWTQPGEFETFTSSPEDAEGGTVGLTGCNKLDFSPKVSIQPDTNAADSPTGLGIDVALPKNESATGLADTEMKEIQVKLPSGMSINAAAAEGLGVCTPAQVGLEKQEEPSCPASSEIGTAEFETPLLARPLVGNIYLGQVDSPFDGKLNGYIVAQGSGITIKLAMQLVLDPITGQITVSVNKLPEVESTGIKLRFNDGPRAVLATPNGCGTFETSSVVTPYSGSTSPAVLAGNMIIDANCGGGFTPTYAAGSTSTGAGEASGFTLQVTRADGEQTIRSVSATLPTGLLAKLGGVPPCEVTQAVAGTCGAASQVGTAIVAAGAGSDPLYLSGGVFLTGPYEGAPFGLSIALHVVAGPFNIGTVVIGGRLLLDRRDAQLTIATDQLPVIADGIVLRIRKIVVNVNRPGFIVNPTNCAARQVTGEVAGAQTTAHVSSPFALTGCSRLPFSPSVSGSTQAKVSRSAGASLNVDVAQPTGMHANIATMGMTFPSQLSPRLKEVQQACRHATFAGNPALCPAGSRIGSATVQTSLLSGAFSGPMYLVSNGTAGPPDIVIPLQDGDVALELIGSLKAIGGGAIALTIDGIPDASISGLQIRLPEGPGAVLGLNSLSKVAGSLCGKKLVLQTTLTGQNGIRVKRSPRVSISGCPKAKSAKHRARR
jgi:hypothetical protein